MFRLAEVYDIEIDPGLFRKLKMLEIRQLERDHARQEAKMNDGK